MEKMYFKKCSTCKTPIEFGRKYYRCSVSTCQHKRKGFHFCSVQCWDGHLGFANHREAWAEETTAPTEAQYQAQESASTSSPRTSSRKVVGTSNPLTAGVSYREPSRPQTFLRRRGGEQSSLSSSQERESVQTPPSQPTSNPTNYTAESQQIESDILVVVSKVKKLIRDQSDFNTSQCAIEALTKKVIEECLRGIERAHEAGRKTVMGRDLSS